MKSRDPVTGEVTDHVRDLIGGDPPLSAPRQVEPPNDKYNDCWECRGTGCSSHHIPGGCRDCGGSGRKCKHEPDFASIAHSDMAVGDMATECIMDVNCRHCGRSGAFRVDLTTEIDW